VAIIALYIPKIKFFSFDLSQIAFIPGRLAAFTDIKAISGFVGAYTMKEDDLETGNPLLREYRPQNGKEERRMGYGRYRNPF
jgi:hypothetical protein